MRTITIFALACLTAPQALLAQTAYTDPAGYVTIPIPGTSGVVASKLQIASQGLLPSDAVQFTGVLESFGTDGGGSFLADTEGTWAAGNYIDSSETPALPTHLVEILDGSLKGTLTWITSTAVGKIYTYDNISAAAAGSRYRVLKAFTITTLLGAIPTSSVLGGSASIGTADNFLLFDAGSNSYRTFWYKSGGPGGIGWRADYTVSTTIPAKTAIHPNDSGMLFVRRQSSDGSLVIAGSVKSGETDIFIKGGSGTVLNIVSLSRPVDSMTPLTSNLYNTLDLPNSIKGDTSIGAADNVLVFDATTNSYTTFWYKTGGPGGTGWRSDNAGITDPGNYVLPAVSAILIQRKSGADFTWAVPAAINP